MMAAQAENFYRVRRLEIAAHLIEAEKVMRITADGWFGINDDGAAEMNQMAEETSVMLHRLMGDEN